MQNKNIKCADAASENCPCWLAETGDCLVCSRLSGKDECDCDWTGVCIYNEFILNNKKRALPRAEEIFEIIEASELKEGGFTILKIACGRGFALKCLNPGTHIFIRPNEREKYYDTPLSILAADHTAGTLTVCFRVISAKTKALAQCAVGSKVTVRGPYRNAITGLPRRMSEHRILLIASGAGIIPAIFASNILSRNNNIELVAGGGTAEKQLMRLYLDENAGSCPDEIIFRDFSSESSNRYCTCDGNGRISVSNTNANTNSNGNGSKLADILQNRNFNDIIILGNVNFTQSIKETAEKFSDAHIAVSNNAPMSCGEGICGACSYDTSDGRHVPRCKCAQLL